MHDLLRRACAPQPPVWKRIELAMVKEELVKVAGNQSPEVRAKKKHVRRRITNAVKAADFFVHILSGDRLLGIGGALNADAQEPQPYGLAGRFLRSFSCSLQYVVGHSRARIQ
eukprot:6190945-Pleurochrysis_carterae.AAC.1